MGAKSFPKQGLCHGLRSCSWAGWAKADRLIVALCALTLLGAWQLPKGHLCPAGLSDSEDGLVPTGYGVRPRSELPNPS